MQGSSTCWFLFYSHSTEASCHSRGGTRTRRSPLYLVCCTLSQMLFSILRSTEPYLDVYFSEAGNIDAELLEAGFTAVCVANASPRPTVRSLASQMYCRRQNSVSFLGAEELTCIRIFGWSSFYYKIYIYIFLEWDSFTVVPVTYRSCGSALSICCRCWHQQATATSRSPPSCTVCYLFVCRCSGVSRRARDKSTAFVLSEACTTRYTGLTLAAVSCTPRHDLQTPDTCSIQTAFSSA